MLKLQDEFLEDEFIEENFDLENNIENGIFEYANIVINNYFIGRTMYNGNQISSSLLNLPYYSKLVCESDICKSVDKCYEIIRENNFKKSKESSMGGLAEDVNYIVSLIKSMKRTVPREFIGGILLMHLEIIEGLEIW